MTNLKNSVRLMGFLGAAPEVKEYAKGKIVAKVNLATKDAYKNQKGEKVEETQWHQLVLWGSQAEFASKYLNKGSEVAIEGRLVTNTYDDKDGIKRYITQVVVNDIVILGRKVA
ncbi:single-stranded DNA-binding protein [Pedobacter sp. SD-b]|uniref:Single-stranded DNA-binding protein n=1 Tax=Pedobacter segetis TaxID=2793069 RepID=A0ABS1BH97_9SPHI|nr:single-stranded DNA-binding protein [Pedobacter segetis]MBK0382197.1 single-stranded DNA-binding protein [Pedobacter segetis]